MSTVDADILYPALRLAGILGGPQHTASPSQLADAFQALNRMIGTWNNESLMVYAQIKNRWSLTGAASYTIGPGGNFDGPRPQRITAAAVAYTPGGPLTDIRVLNDTDMNQNPPPSGVYCDRASPLAVVTLVGHADAAELELTTWSALPRFAAQDDDVELPDGYEDAMVYNLAERLAAQWSRAPNPHVVDNAKKTKAAIKGLASRPAGLDTRDSGMPKPPGGFDYRTGNLK